MVLVNFHIIVVGGSKEVKEDVDYEKAIHELIYDEGHVIYVGLSAKG